MFLSFDLQIKVNDMIWLTFDGLKPLVNLQAQTFRYAIIAKMEIFKYLTLNKVKDIDDFA